MDSLPARRRPTRAVALLAVGATSAALLVAAASPATGAGHPVDAAKLRAAAAAGSVHTVTLITGDVVQLTDTGEGTSLVSVTRPRGAVGGVRQETAGGHTYVIPDEALPYLAANRVDRRLFDVTGLIAQGYDDLRSASIPLIVRYDSATPSRQKALPGTTRTRSLRSVDGAAVRATKTRTRGLWSTLTPESRRAQTRGKASSAPTRVTPGAPATPATTSLLGAGVASVWLDAKVHTLLAESTAQIGAPAAWAAGFDGRGVKVAVLDTGYDTAHPDLQGRVVASQSFIAGETIQDGNSHGTHTASTVGGSGAASGGLEKGVAWRADLLIGKVLSDAGSGDDSGVIAGMEWAAAQGARVVSMSLGGDTPSAGDDPLCHAIDTISASSGALFVVAAGNTGNEGAMSCPGAADSALTVAAVDSSDLLAAFSTMGPRAGDYALKPDIAAPGVDVLAAKAGGTADTGYYMGMSGTSMATPHVAGAAAVLAQEHPDWTGPMIKDALMSTSHELSGTTAYQVGAGRVDLAAATTSMLVATGSAYFGFVAYPHPDPAPVSRTITYTNAGSTTMELDLAETVAIAGGPYDVDPFADAGTPAPDGMFGLSAAHLTVPAHGTATVTATANPSQGQSARRYLGQVVATSGGTVVARTQVGLYEEEERHDLIIDVKDRSGAPAATYLELQQQGTSDVTVVPVDASGTVKLRMRPGTYSLVTYLPVAGSHGIDSRGIALLGAPEVVLDRDRHLSLDASKAVEVTATVPKVTEDRLLYLDWYRKLGADSVVSGQYVLPSYVDTMYALPTEKVTTGEFEFEARWRKAFPLLQIANRDQSVKTLMQAGSSAYAGKGRLRVVDGGEGTAADLAKVDARGAFLLVRHSSAVDSMTRAQNAADAGAALLGVVADTAAPVQEYVGTDTGADSAVPVVSLSQETGTALLTKAASGRFRLAVTGTPDSPYVYDLVSPYPDRIPASLSFRPRASELATVDMRFHGTTSRTGGEFRWDFRPYRPSSFGFPLKQTMPATRIDYVSTQPGVQWAESAVTGPNFEWVTSSDTHAFTPGKRTVDDWFGAVTRPADNAAFIPSYRYSGFLTFNVQPWSDGGAGHAGYLQFNDTKHLDVYQGGVKIKESDFAQASIFPVEDGAQDYTLDLTAERDPSAFTTSVRTHTVWQVHSPAISNGLDTVDLMPVLQVAYDVKTDLANRVHGGEQSIGISVHHLPGAAGGGTVGRPTVWTSYDDGKHWRRAKVVVAADGTTVARFEAPERGFASLRVSAKDDRGNAVTQDVIRAFGLR